MKKDIEKPNSFHITECSLSSASSLSFNKEGFLENYTGFNEHIVYTSDIVGGYLERENDESGESLFEVLFDKSRRQPVIYITVLKQNSDTHRTEVLELDLTIEEPKNKAALIEAYNKVIVAFDETREHSLAKAFDLALQYC
ncbi:hypothetical protein [Klebsiella quasipneumoniae]|uniref:hypothetical protein n=1 Tax=Klebsiella quasipneumoniae TaxID=1463165 RepID=UPI0023B1981C|nr:hypothetical protein [Klebsiella quasipneumoniae]